MTQDYTKYNTIVAQALGLDVNDFEGTSAEVYAQLSNAYDATQARSQQMINELTSNGVEFGTCPWIKYYSVDDAEYFATLLQDEVEKYGYVNIL